MSPGLVRRAEEFEDVAFAISDMYATRGCVEDLCGLTHVFQPAIAFLLLNGHPGGVDFLFERIGALELFAGPELDGRQPQRESGGGDGQARMHENAALGVEARAPFLNVAEVGSPQKSERRIRFALIAKLTGVMQYEHVCVQGGGETFPYGFEMSGQDIRLAHPLI